MVRLLGIVGKKKSIRRVGTFRVTGRAGDISIYYLCIVRRYSRYPRLSKDNSARPSLNYASIRIELYRAYIQEGNKALPIV